MSAVPTATPNTSPVPDTVATVGSELLHAPAAEALASVIVWLIQTDEGPVMAAGARFTVTSAVVIQPVGAVYVMVEVPPVSAVHVPVDRSIEATVPVPDVHVPDGVALLSVADAP